MVSFIDSDKVLVKSSKIGVDLTFDPADMTSWLIVVTATEHAQ